MHRSTKKEPTLCDFERVEFKTRRKRLIKIVFVKRFLDIDEIAFLKSLEWQAEDAQNKIAHVRSLIDKAMLKMAGR